MISPGQDAAESDEVLSVVRLTFADAVAAWSA